MTVKVILTKNIPKNIEHLMFETVDQLGIFSEFFSKVGVISWLLFHLIWKKLRSILRFWFEKLNCCFFTRFAYEKTSQNNFSVWKWLFLYFFFNRSYWFIIIYNNWQLYFWIKVHKLFYKNFFRQKLSGVAQNIRKLDFIILCIY